MKIHSIYLFVTLHCIQSSSFAGNRLDEFIDKCSESTNQCEIYNGDGKSILTNCASCYEAMHKLNKAEKYYTRILRQDPNNSVILERRANICFKLERFTCAIQDSTLSLKLFNENADLLELRGDSYARIKNFESALHDYLMALELHGFSEEDLEEATFSSPWMSNLLARIGSIYSEMENLNAAKQYYTYAVNLDKNNNAAKERLDIIEKKL